jgi:hypothetical protein
MPLRTSIALLVAFALAAGGCGGGSGSESFASEATQICAEATAEIRALGAPESFTETQLYARRAKDAVSDELAALRDLDPPAESEDAFARYLGTLEQRRTELDRLAEAADGNSMTSVQQAGSALGALEAKARREAQSAGIPECEPG